MIKTVRSVFLAFVFLTVLLSGCTPATPTVEIKIGQHPYPYHVQIETADNLTKTVALNYLLYLPSDYGKDSKQKWPLMLYLHGIGEMGDDLELLKNNPLPKTLEHESAFPIIVLSPQLPLEMEYWSDPVIDQLDVLLDKIQDLYSIDNKRVYLTGLSLGGAGAWEYALRYPQRFAAVVPIAGFYEYDSDAIPDNICDLKDLPMWVFHGAQDTIVMPDQSEILVDALEACGGNVKFTLYPAADHEAAWIQAYADPELYEWLLEQRLR